MKKKIISIFLIFSIIFIHINPVIVFAYEKIEEESKIEKNEIIENYSDNIDDEIEEETEDTVIQEEKEEIEEETEDTVIQDEKEEEIEEETKEEEQIDEKEKEEIEEEQKEVILNQENANNPHIEYSTHIQSYGWQEKKKDGEISGTQGEAKRLEAIRINLSSSISGSVEYISYIQSIGWDSSFRKDGEISGTSGLAKRLEAIQIRLTGEISKKYDIYYKVHVENYGWLNWAKNGETSGTIGLSKRLEAIEIKLVLKGQGENTSNTFYQKKDYLSYTTHVQNKGWLNRVESGISGSIGESKRIEAYKVSFEFAKKSGSLIYKSYIEGIGWEKNWKKNNELSGTEGQAKRIEQIKIDLTGDVANYYDIYYRTHIQGFGWLGWAKNGEAAGSEGINFRIECIEIKLVLKGQGENTGNSLEKKDAKLTYNSHIRKLGDQSYVSEGKTTGTTGRNLRMEALTIKLDTKLSGNILYKTYVDQKGWEKEYKKNGETSGTTGEGKGIQLLRIKLDGDLGKRYDVYYRIHTETYGWLDWAKNDEITGADCFDIQAVEIRLYLKVDSSKNSLPRKTIHRETGFYQQNGYTYYKDKNGNQATDWIHIMDKKYFFNSLGVMIGKNVKKVMDVSAWQKDIDWEIVQKEGDLDGVIVRIAASAIYEDSKLERNIKALKKWGIPYGIYIYSYAENKEEAKDYANFTVELINKYDMNPTIGIFLDLEGNSLTNHLTVNDYEEITKAYMKILSDNGYGNITKIYTYKSLAEEKFYTPYLFNQITWIAQYYHFNTYKNNNVVGWQYSSSEIMPGIKGTVDMSVWFTDF